jgi:hypothetical protein
MIRSHIWILAVLMIASCGGSSGDGPKTPTDDPTAVTTGDDFKTADSMVGHFIEITAIERALVDGDLDEVHARANKLVAADHPEEWGTNLERFREAAGELARSVDVATAAMAMSDTVGQCGACHRGMGVAHEPPPLPEPADASSVEVRMKRHQWATDLLRTAIVFSHEGMWNEGVRIMTDAPLDPSELSGEGAIDPNLVAWIDNVRALGTAASGATSADWGTIYGDLLTNCAGCHQVER